MDSSRGLNSIANSLSEKLQFSVNEEVIVPGLELTFDTHKTLAFTQTTFSV